jgi:hypothetical protein
MTTRTRKGRDVAWGFFRTSVFGYRTLEIRRSPKTCREWHAILSANNYSSPGPIFKITEPANPRSRKP